MSRKSLILCLSVLFATIIALGIAVAFLYSGTDAGIREKKVHLKDAFSCLAAVPSDAVLVVCSSAADKACDGMLSSFALPDSLAAAVSNGTLTSLKRCPLSVSLHYSGKLNPLYVFDLGNISDVSAALLEDKIVEYGFFTEKKDGFLLASDSESLVKSSSRHIDGGISIADAPGFVQAVESVEGRDLLFVPHRHIRRILSAAGEKSLIRMSSFVEHVADWSAFAVISEAGCPVSLKGMLLFDGDPDEYITVLDKCTPSVSKVADVLPSYTVSFVTLPVSDLKAYVSAYKSYMDSRQLLHTMLARQGELEKASGISPEGLLTSLDVQEVASAAFMVEGKEEKVNLMRVANKDVALIFKGNDVASLRGYRPATHTWAYPSFLSSAYGSLFALKDESSFTYVDGWIISGSKAAVEEYVVRKALDYTLSQYLADAGRPDLLSSVPVLATAYRSLTEGRPEVILKPVARKIISGALDSEFAPAVMHVVKDKGQLSITAAVHSLTLKKTKAPLFDRDTTVNVPKGPFKVRNSHTGKMNTFYQNSARSICLRDENGKDLWGVPFGKSVCGTAHNVDYFANGKLQILFGAGSCLYVIDRLGRYVGGFPVDLGKEILVGPDVYDFSGAKRYNVMVLHKDNTIDMYNLKGRKPEQWKGITAQETIKGLPQRLTLSGKDFWIVRTSVQTLIFPFYGGEPLTVFEGDQKIRPDSEIRTVDGVSVEFSCYDGKKRTLKLK